MRLHPKPSGEFRGHLKKGKFTYAKGPSRDKPTTRMEVPYSSSVLSDSEPRQQRTDIPRVL
jgi:hypothetical protein